MQPEQDRDQIQSARASLLGVAGTGVLRIALLFGSAAVALTLIMAPFAENYARSQVAGGFDMISTGSTPMKNSYTIRRSVLQPAPESVCIIRPNGSRSGEC
jgi:hypothetical protein